MGRLVILCFLLDDWLHHHYLLRLLIILSFLLSWHHTHSCSICVVNTLQVCYYIECGHLLVRVVFRVVTSCQGGIQGGHLLSGWYSEGNNILQGLALM